jgi:hypothetical protein
MLLVVVDTYYLEGIVWRRSTESADIIVPTDLCVPRGDKKGGYTT